MRTRFIAVATAGVAAALLLTGCTPAPHEPVKTATPVATETPTPSATSRPQPSSTPTPIPVPTTEVDPLDTVVQITVRPEQLELKDASGKIIAGLSYDLDVKTFVQNMIWVIGTEPTISDTPGGSEWWPVTHYKWPGFEVMDDHETGVKNMDMNLAVVFLEPVIGGDISVSTIQGFQPGDDLGWLARYMDEPYSPDSDFNQVQAEHGPPIGPKYSEKYSNSNSVTGQNRYQHEGSVIFAPFNFGIGHV